MITITKKLLLAMQIMSKQNDPEWHLVYDKFDPKQVRYEFYQACFIVHLLIIFSLREALCVLGNGLYATRGAAEESCADGTHYPATYIAGAYNRLCKFIEM